MLYVLPALHYTELFFFLTFCSILIYLIPRCGPTTISAISSTGKKVEVWQSHHGKWFTATVLRTSNAGKVMVKFDLYPNDKYDKWFEVSSPNIRLPAAAAAAPPAAAAAVPAAGGDADKTPSKDKIKAEIKSPVITIKKKN